MKETPILFSAPMVRAILDGRKTQTRRVVKPQPPERLHSIWKRFPNQRGCPYGEPGDRLWVRETFQVGESQPYADGKSDRVAIYRATACDADRVFKTWHPSIHMPRWASRITLEIISVRVERVQEISEEDAAGEGVEAAAGCYTADFALHGYVDGFHQLWDIINAKRGHGWDKNPWVWAIEFKRA